MLCHKSAHALAWNYSLDRIAEMPGIDPVKFNRASHDEAWGFVYAQVWRAYLEAGVPRGGLVIGMVGRLLGRPTNC